MDYAPYQRALAPIAKVKTAGGRGGPSKLIRSKRDRNRAFQAELDKAFRAIMRREGVTNPDSEIPTHIEFELETFATQLRKKWCV